MIAFHISLNGEKVCTAGIGEEGVLSAHVCWVRRTGTRTLSKNSEGIEEELTMDVGGLMSLTGEHVGWSKERPVKVGDEVRIKVVETREVDAPSIRQKPDREKDLRAQKRYVKAMAEKFGWIIQTNGDDD